MVIMTNNKRTVYTMRRKTITLTGICIILLLMSSCARTTSVSVPKEQQTPNQFYFVQISDTHLGVNNNELRVQKTVSEINNLPMKIEFVAHTGDITEEKLENEAI